MSFFLPPRRIETTIFTRLPDRFRKPRRTAWADANRGGRASDGFLEGPSFDRDGRLYVVDIPHGRVFRVDPAGTWERAAEYQGWPNGLKIHRDGRHTPVHRGVGNRPILQAGLPVPGLAMFSHRPAATAAG